MTITLACNGIFFNGIFYDNEHVLYTTQTAIPAAQFIDWAQIRAGPNVGLRVIILDEEGRVTQVTQPIAEILEAKAA